METFKDIINASRTVSIGGDGYYMLKKENLKHLQVQANRIIIHKTLNIQIFTIALILSLECLDLG